MTSVSMMKSVRSVRPTCRPRPVVNAPSASPIRAHTRRGAQRSALVVAAAYNPPTVSETKQKFIEAYNKPIPAIYNTVIQELLVQQHFYRYNVNYQYDEIFALGFVSVFDQILDEYDEVEREKIFAAYIKALGETPEQYRKDATNLESWASSAGSSDALVPDADGSDLQKVLATVAGRVSEGKFAYSKYFAIGLFRLLELTGAKEPAALEKLVKAAGVRPDLVNKDLMLYKGILSKLSAAKELFRDFLEREKKKQAEREANKAAKAAAPAADAEAPVQA